MKPVNPCPSNARIVLAKPDSPIDSCPNTAGHMEPVLAPMRPAS
jgi:hypothetical protein